MKLKLIAGIVITMFLVVVISSTLATKQANAQNPTSTATSNIKSLDLALNTELVDAINAYREANGQQALTVNYNLTYVSSGFTYLQLVQKNGKNLFVNDIPATVMPDNYQWWTFNGSGNDSTAKTWVSGKAVFQYVSKKYAKDLLNDKATDIGATFMCSSNPRNGCSYTIIFGRSN